MKCAPWIASAAFLLFAAAAFAADGAAIEPLVSPEPLPNDIFTPEEVRIKKALQKEFDAMKARAFILRGTRLYLYEPHHSRYYNINSLGLRGGEPAPKKKNGFNIMVMGGSTVFGDWTKADDQTIPALLEKHLRSRHSGRDVAVYNLGVVGYEFQREIDLAKKFAERLEPDLVIFYHGGNNAFFAYSSGYFPVRVFTEEDETELVKKIGSDTRLFRQLRMLRKRIYGESWERRSVPDAQKEANLSSFVRGYLGDAVEIDRYFRERGVPAIFVLQPILATRAGRTSREEEIARSSDKQRPGLADFYRDFYSGLMASKEAENLHIRDFSDAFNGHRGELYFDPIHVNLAGNRIIAEKLFELIEREGLMPPKKPAKGVRG